MTNSTSCARSARPCAAAARHQRMQIYSRFMAEQLEHNNGPGSAPASAQRRFPFADRERDYFFASDSRLSISEYISLYVRCVALGEPDSCAPKMIAIVSMLTYFRALHSAFTQVRVTMYRQQPQASRSCAAVYALCDFLLAFPPSRK